MENLSKHKIMLIGFLFLMICTVFSACSFAGMEITKSDGNQVKGSFENNKVNINTSTKEVLTSLSGIGEAKAQKIIDYRNENGLFKSIEDLKNVTGISEKLFEQIKEFITI